MKYFQDCKDVAEVKRVFRGLAMQYHPDCGGSDELFKELNNQYQQALKNLNGYKSKSESGKEYTYSYNQEVEEDIANKISDLLSLRLSGIEINLIGSWIWIIGDTKPHKDALKDQGCRWHSKRKCWYFTLDQRRSFYSDKGFNELAKQYGFKNCKEDNNRKMIRA